MYYKQECLATLQETFSPQIIEFFINK
nr:hypothetical protein REP96_pgp154 [Hypnea musciformis]WCH56872.1 hypothetical protein [Hypnea musciformis]WCH57072.1 hypothetical protein [Hypnea musciformis]